MGRVYAEGPGESKTPARPWGRPAEAVTRGLSVTEGVPGRFQAVRAGQPFSVIIDYSHTPDSLENALRAARSVARGRAKVLD